MSELVQIDLRYQVDERQSDRFVRVGGQGALDALLLDIHRVFEEFKESLIEVQAVHQEKLNEITRSNVVRIDRK